MYFELKSKAAYKQGQLFMKEILYFCISPTFTYIQWRISRAYFIHEMKHIAFESGNLRPAVHISADMSVLTL